ncbi:Nem1-Spo7 phosphatase regulatory subunit SPO7 [Saccharomyces paradoxus]|uniref:Nem1-Spo7 phosphatase regulatory subunit SPO7 n=1 Tax=Saccharomyces paradoxus TaxID=27291 RepID=A0A8B8UL05_SACPA|nr:Spo7 [Saccharomyces paradoxus]QHS71432.1 Spo7 [Saccharomyces paradoxus]
MEPESIGDVENHTQDDSGSIISGPRKRSTSKTSSAKNIRNSSNISPASMIFRNLLILEDDLRRQAHEQKILKWQFTLFLASMAGVGAFTFYELYFTTDYVKGFHRVILQFTLSFISITVVLFHISGQYRRTIVIPRRFFTSTNKGIRQFNVKLVKVQSTWDEKYTDSVRFVSRSIAYCNIYCLKKFLWLKDDNTIVKFWKSVTIQSQPRIGAVDVKLVLNPRAFSAEIREGWEIYRDEFWAREGARRRKQAHELRPKSE